LSSAYRSSGCAPLLPAAILVQVLMLVQVLILVQVLMLQLVLVILGIRSHISSILLITLVQCCGNISSILRSTLSGTCTCAPLLPAKSSAFRSHIHTQWHIMRSHHGPLIMDLWSSCHRGWAYRCSTPCTTIIIVGVVAVVSTSSKKNSKGFGFR
jgi:hypothetical protein